MFTFPSFVFFFFLSFFIFRFFLILFIYSIYPRQPHPQNPGLIRLPLFARLLPLFPFQFDSASKAGSHHRVRPIFCIPSLFSLSISLCPAPHLLALIKLSESLASWFKALFPDGNAGDLFLGGLNFHLCSLGGRKKKKKTSSFDLCGELK